MTTNIAGNPANYPANVRAPSGTDYRNATIAAEAIQDLADRTAYLAAAGSARSGRAYTVSPVAWDITSGLSTAVQVASTAGTPEDLTATLTNVHNGDVIRGIAGPFNLQAVPSTTGDFTASVRLRASQGSENYLVNCAISVSSVSVLVSATWARIPVTRTVVLPFQITAPADGNVTFYIETAGGDATYISQLSSPFGTQYGALGGIQWLMWDILPNV